jgi:hypothetical protein
VTAEPTIAWELPQVWPGVDEVNVFAQWPAPTDPDPMAIRGRSKEIAAVLGQRDEFRTVACLLPESDDPTSPVGVWVEGRRVGTASKNAATRDHLRDVYQADGFCACEVVLFVDDGTPRGALFPPLTGPMTRVTVAETLVTAGFPAAQRDDERTVTVAGVETFWTPLDSGTQRLMVEWRLEYLGDDYTWDKRKVQLDEQREIHKEISAALRKVGYQARVVVDTMGYGLINVLGHAE